MYQLRIIFYVDNISFLVSFTLHTFYRPKRSKKEKKVKQNSNMGIREMFSP